MSVDGVDTTEWNDLSDAIRTRAGERDVPIVVVRGGERLTLHADITTNRVPRKDDRGMPVRDAYVNAGFLGFSPATGVYRQDFGESVVWMGDRAEDAVDGLIALPAKIPALWDAAFGDGPREEDSPMGIIGAARVGGEVATMDIPATQQVAFFVFLLAGFNLSLFLFNMLPLLPLDGGHIAGAFWESLRRKLARVLRRPDPGPFDVAKLMPAAYVVAAVFVCFTVLVGIADVVNPVRVS
jgi:membrane-associated protease RseP (regulator of RpoE activity)